MKNGENMQVKDNINTYEEMLIRKAKSHKSLDENYKFLECIERVLKINPKNREALSELASYMGEGNV